MGRAILANVTVNGSSVVVTGGAPNASVQVWCTNTAANDGSSSGAVTMAVVNAASVAQAFSAPSIAALTPRVEYVLTATKEMYTRHRETGEGGGGGGRSASASTSAAAGRALERCHLLEWWTHDGQW